MFNRKKENKFEIVRFTKGEHITVSMHKIAGEYTVVAFDNETNKIIFSQARMDSVEADKVYNKTVFEYGLADLNG